MNSFHGAISLSDEFYRKETFERFGERFLQVKEIPHKYVLANTLIFKCRCPSATFSIPGIGNYQYQVKGSLLEISKNAGSGFRPRYSWAESKINELLRSGEGDGEKAKAVKNSEEYIVLRFLTKRHANSSKHSPFISGLPSNTLGDHKTFEGQKLVAKIRRREPFKNPDKSGIEKEVLLIGELHSSDCEKLAYLGYDTKREHVSVDVDIPLIRPTHFAGLKRPDDPRPITVLAPRSSSVPRGKGNAPERKPSKPTTKVVLPPNLDSRTNLSVLRDKGNASERIPSKPPTKVVLRNPSKPPTKVVLRNPSKPPTKVVHPHDLDSKRSSSVLRDKGNAPEPNPSKPPTKVTLPRIGGSKWGGGGK
jgi:hypothetical protein